VGKISRAPQRAQGVEGYRTLVPAGQTRLRSEFRHYRTVCKKLRTARR